MTLPHSNRPMAEPHRIARLVAQELITHALDCESEPGDAETHPLAEDLTDAEKSAYLEALERIGDRLEREAMRGWPRS